MNALHMVLLFRICLVKRKRTRGAIQKLCMLKYPEAWLLVSVVMLPGSEIIPRLKITLLSILEQWFSGVGSVSIAFVRIVMLIIIITYSCF